jgi:cell division transport system permease protein
MAQFGKASAKRGKPSYVYAIIGVSLVLFLFGIVGWIFLNIRKTGEYFKENIQLHAWLDRTAGKKQVDSVKNYLEALPYTRKVEYVSREMAIQKYSEDNDTSWRKILDNNPLPASIDFHVRADHMQQDSLTLLEDDLRSTFPNVINGFQYPKMAVAAVNKYVRSVGLWILVIAIILSLLVIVSIDNTIRLAMYSNRFIIKTMQMVGATRGFIARPLEGRALINGLIASLIAIGLLTGLVILIENYEPTFKILHDNTNMLLLYGGMIVLGLFITLFSTHRSVLKYLKMKLDDLY